MTEREKDNSEGRGCQRGKRTTERKHNDGEETQRWRGKTSTVDKT